jgi:hypothetical protein
MNQYPPPLLRATAHRVDGGLTDRDTTNDGYNNMDMKGMDGNTSGCDTGPMTGTMTWTQRE